MAARQTAPEIYVFSDCETRRSTLFSTLLAAGFASLSFPEGSDGAAIEGQPLVLVDGSEGDGPQLLRRMNGRPGAVIRSAILIAPADMHRDLLVECLRLGATDYLYAPATALDLSAALDRALLRRAGREAVHLHLAAEPADPAGTIGKPAPQTMGTADMMASAPLQTIVHIERLKGRHRNRLEVDEIELNMLLDLAWSAANRRPMSVTGLAFGSGAPLATAHRRLRKLEGQGLIERQRCLTDRRQVLLRLTASGWQAVTNLEADLQRLPARIASESRRARPEIEPATRM